MNPEQKKLLFNKYFVHLKIQKYVQIRDFGLAFSKALGVGNAGIKSSVLYLNYITSNTG